MARVAGEALEQAERRLGELLRDRYRLHSVIGVGGMATVYLAVHRNGNRVAVKILRAELSVIDSHRKRFVREAYVANSLEHPGAVRVLDDDIADDGCPFLVMELLEGETLEARYQRLGRLEPREVLALGHSLCGVLARAHAVGVIHRDIKPENLFLTEDGALKVLDFGIASVRHEGRTSRTQTGDLMGTPAYMPPEQAIGRRRAIDGRSDLWSVGATMFTLLAGRAVHEVETPEEMIVRSATEPAPSLALICPELPPAITALVDQALAFAPEDRFADAEAMRGAIAAAHLEVYGAAVEETPLPRGEAPEPLASGRPTESDTPSTFSAETLASADARALTVLGRRTSVLAGPPTRAEPAPVGPSAVHPPDVAARAPSSSATLGRRSARASGRTRGLLAGLGIVGVIGIGAVAAVAGSSGGALPAEPSEGSEPECSAHAECSPPAGERWICRKDQGRCVALETDRCEILAEEGDVDNDDTFWIGAMYPASDSTNVYGAEARSLVELARRDFMDLTGGLPPLRLGGRPRPIGVVFCDDTVEYERSAAHLIDDVGVPAILGFALSKEVLDLANEHFIPKGVLALASNTAGMISSIPHPAGQERLVYRMTTSAAMVTPPMIAFARAIVEPRLRSAEGDVGADGEMRIAILRSSNASGTSHSDALFTGLVESGGRDEVRHFTVENPGAGAVAQVRAPAAQVAEFAPHLVLDGGADTDVLAAIEAAWSEGPRPRYIYGGVATHKLRELARAQPDLPRRFFTIATRRSPTSEKVQAHYHAAFGSGERADISSTPYDAFYVLAYAAIALGEEPVSGRSLARAMRRLVPPGEPIEVGPAGIYPALNILAGGGRIDLQGTLTTLDFDPVSGDATADFAVFCLSPDGELLESDTRYDAATGSVIGEGRCP